MATSSEMLWRWVVYLSAMFFSSYGSVEQTLLIKRRPVSPWILRFTSETVVVVSSSNSYRLLDEVRTKIFLSAESLEKDLEASQIDWGNVLMPSG